MRKISRLQWLGAGLFLGTLLFPVLAIAQQPFPWESTLENAQRIAAQNNRLVLIHFWAPWCGKCKKMENEVFNQPGVAAALLVNYVPVKINADLMSSTATKYGITGLPSDVIITPQGQVVDFMRGQIEATQFVARLNQIASARQQNAGQTAQVPANIPARPAERSTAEQTPPSNQSATNSTSSDDRYADYYRRNPDNQPVLSAAMPAGEPIQPNPATVSPPYGQQQPPAGPELSGPSLVQSPATSPQQVRNITPPMTANVPQQAMANPSQQAMANPQQQAMPNLPQPSAANPVQQSPLAFNPSLPPPGANTPQQAVPPSRAASQPPAAAPSLCLDGFCPVSLAEKQQWVPGDRRWGVIHRGRVYLFVGPEEQKRFYANPDRYAPVISGNDIVQVMEKGQTVPGMREHGVLYNGHIFLFADESTLDKFSRNPAYYANQALEAIQASAHPAQQLR
jgi:protein disulfide-isomerase